MTTLELLKEARDRIAKGWTQNASARDGLGIAVNARNSQAISFCAGGVLGVNPNYGSATSRPTRPGPYDWSAVDALAAALPKDAVTLLPHSGMGAIVNFNDNPETTKEDVLALYDRAIQAVYLASGLKTCYNP